jgi:hypothetical protein
MSNIKKVLQELQNMTEKEREQLIEELSNEQETNGKKRKQVRRKKIINTEESDVRPPRKVKRISRASEQRGRRNKGMQAVGERIDTSGKKRPNLFIKRGFHKLEKKDVEIDKLLNKDRTPSERRDEQELWEMECSQCGRVFECHPSMAYKDPEEGYVAVCERCGGRR